MDTYLHRIARLFEPRWETALAWLDILVVAFIIFRLFLLVRGPRAWRIVVAVFMFVLLLIVSHSIQFYELHWILDKAALLGPVALVILLLPELRQGLEGLGKLGVDTFQPLQKLGRTQAESRTDLRTIEEIVAAVAELAAGNIGALIVVERAFNLDEIASNGVKLNAEVSSPTLVSIFFEGNPLHDGAVVIRKEKILAAACRLPLSESSRLAQNVHMRHRAAVGISEATDALAIIVSEERGTISYALDGSLRRLGAAVELRDLLNREVRGEEVMRRRRTREKEREEKKVMPA
ncbi:MAG TPA: diadenylate cyclase CdaA [Fimbriimonadaceae bacterium]|nr:diadenylate cyclase CdaA [Fimbriimonadaceae bacterium]